MIYVTHDQVEAMTLADKIVVLQAGRIEQVGSPRELYERPDNLFVAQFIGSPKMNVLPCSLEEGRFSLRGHGGGPYPYAAAGKHRLNSASVRSTSALQHRARGIAPGR